MWLTRDLTAEFATAKVMLPRSKKALPVEISGKIDDDRWNQAQEEYGPAARVGDLVQITKVEYEKTRILFEINGGFKGGRKWYQRIQVSGSTGVSTVPMGGSSTAPAGTQLALVFPEGVPAVEAADIKKYLTPILDFEKRSATEQYVKSLPAPIQAAIEEKRATEGMDRDMVLIALGKPNHKVRETKDGVEVEDWVYGKPPGKVTFVTFQGDKVVTIRERYAGLGGSVAPPLEPR
ncbi:MAG: hypothetical protein KIT09_01180 [Bryobacteraceae bacterium]|nr:hypothetical protein [Bryobacteraceae bacterium]